MMGILTTVFWGVIVLSLLVFIHEGGHYLAARACGVRVTEFFLGMPSRFRLSHKSADHGTEVGVTPILLGGYTRICGMEATSDDLLGPALMCVQRHGRVSVEDLASEIGCDGDRAYEVLATLTDWASIRPFYNPELGEREGQKDWPAAFETLRRDGRLLTEYDRGHDFSEKGSTDYGEPRVPTMGEAEFLSFERARTYQGQSLWKRCFMIIAGPVVNLVLAFVIVVACMMAVGVTEYTDPTTLSKVQEGSYAAAAGLEAGDTITAVGPTQVRTYTEMREALKSYLQEGRDFQISYERDGSPHTVTIDLPDGQPADALGVVVQREYRTVRLSFPEAVAHTFTYAKLVGTFAVRLIMPQHTMETLSQSSSIVGISVMASEAASMGLYDLMLFVAAISMSLGFMNLLPIPPLDGGKILIELVQSVLRRDLSKRALTIFNYAGLAFFLFVFIVVLKNDIVRFVIG